MTLQSAPAVFLMMMMMMIIIIMMWMTPMPCIYLVPKPLYLLPSSLSLWYCAKPDSLC